MKYLRRANKLLSLYRNARVMSHITQRPLPEWMLERITRDVAGAHSSAHAERTQRDHYLFCSITNGSLRCRYRLAQLKHFRLLALLQFFHQLSRRFTLPDVDFAIYYGDALEAVPTWVGMPTLAFAKKTSSEGPILIPDFEMLAGYSDLTRQCDRYCSAFPWETKSARAFWRGAATGLQPFAQTPRVQLALTAARHPEFLDAKLSAFPQHTTIPEEGAPLHGAFASLKAHFGYKYLIDVDGNSCAYSRTYWTLLSNSLPLKQRSTNIQWYYGGLKEGSNICFFSSDPIDAIRRLQERDHYARALAEEGRAFAQRYLTMDYCASYVLHVLDALRSL